MRGAVDEGVASRASLLSAGGSASLLSAGGSASVSSKSNRGGSTSDVEGCCVGSVGWSITDRFSDGEGREKFEHRL